MSKHPSAQFHLCTNFQYLMMNISLSFWLKALLQRLLALYQLSITSVKIFKLEKDFKKFKFSNQYLYKKLWIMNEFIILLEKKINWWNNDWAFVKITEIQFCFRPKPLAIFLAPLHPLPLLRLFPDKNNYLIFTSSP